MSAVGDYARIASRCALIGDIGRDAEFSDDGRYRHWLMRDWGLRRFSDGREPFALWVGHNPSTAGAEHDDPTVRREAAFTHREGFFRYVKVNVFDYVATDPSALVSVPGLAQSADNLDLVRDLAERAAIVVCCWGRVDRRLSHYVDEMARVLWIIRPGNLWCLGRCADGSPRHPLYMPRSARLEKWHPIVPTGRKWSP